MVDYTLCYVPADGKLHIGRKCGEEQEKFVGEITDAIADAAGYVGNGNVLRLKNFSFSTSADLALAVPGGTRIVFEGENKIQVANNKPDANVGVLYSSGDLTLSGSEDSQLNIHAQTEQGLWSRAVCARAGDLVIEGGVIIAHTESAKKSCGLYAGGHLWIEIGDKGKIVINGGRLSVTAGRNAIRAAEGKLLIAAGARVENAQEFSGTDAWAGDCLSPVDMEKPVTIFF